MRNKVTTILDKATELELGMSNMDGSIDDGLAEALKQQAGSVYAQHAAWNFCGYVWYENGMFHEEVWVYNAPRTVINADTLQELMSDVNAEYGSG